MSNDKNNLGKLKKVELREAWKHEASNFTQWLAEEENLSLLGDEIGFDIKLLQTEGAVGSFNVDILAEEENTGRKIIIENQLEVTNHDHLGKIITYASGYDAQIIVWVVKDAREEHRQAVDWLNEHTDEDIEFYLVQIELWQIESSPYAPKFEIISKPNDWTKAVRSATDTGELTDTKVKQLEFWNRFKEYAKRRQTELYIPDNKELYAKLLQHKDEIEDGLGEKPEWMERPTKKASGVRILKDGDFNDESKWETYFEWLLNEAEKLHRVFPK